MACILLDVDGVLHVSGRRSPARRAAVAEPGSGTRSAVTNNSTRPRAQLAEELRGLGFELDDDEPDDRRTAAQSSPAGASSRS